MTMGTASTMTSAAEALGVTVPGAGSIPAAELRHAVMGVHTGRRIVDMVGQDVRLSTVLTRTAFRNAITTVLALGGSTNAIGQAGKQVFCEKPLAPHGRRVSASSTPKSPRAGVWSWSGSCAATTTPTGR